MGEIVQLLGNVVTDLCNKMKAGSRVVSGEPTDRRGKLPQRRPGFCIQPPSPATYTS